MKKIICAWIGTFKSEEELHRNYLEINYANQDNPESQFGRDVGLEYYDEDFMESWWFENLELNIVSERNGALPDSKHFYDDLVNELKTRSFTNRNSITFMFGDESSNELLFNYSGMDSTEKPIEFVFRKEYVI